MIKVILKFFELLGFLKDLEKTGNKHKSQSQKILNRVQDLDEILFEVILSQNNSIKLGQNLKILI